MDTKKYECVVGQEDNYESIEEVRDALRVNK